MFSRKDAKNEELRLVAYCSELVPLPRQPGTKY